MDKHRCPECFSDQVARLEWVEMNWEHQEFASDQDRPFHCAACCRQFEKPLEPGEPWDEGKKAKTAPGKFIKVSDWLRQMDENPTAAKPDATEQAKVFKAFAKYLPKL